ncbi:hypothetical protein FYA67_03165 [Bordetella holmesii]|uniref:Uncharacterized protein n=3 Tax=Bordetella holmesii TaxID=35814 RepID=A0A158M208_9BORD|nr:hypothetical protein D560_2080 [Bordetella holmesii ATCC 51541]AIT26729.1 hypothetical protein D558_2061 [Bordetella holmesii 44057]AMD45683.1 hypothetical protein H558_09360 [Bordetella holmesii H558]AMD50564.1 hypothetical protein F783_008720 [Bordetella holmesii F627]AOB34570.1 hypothetical protein BBB42_03115 [Bordetella holmesii]EWM42714.1 hypothetical protein D556_2075 [Bordetella holmesii 41130]EXF88722.1 hypothetical protein D554_1535 [Bordetella holmesii 30539]EXX96545.1 hypothet
MICAAGMPLATVLHALTHLPAQVSDNGTRRQGDEGQGTEQHNCDVCSALDAFEEALLGALPPITGAPPQPPALAWAARSSQLVAPRWFEPRAPPARPPILPA